MSENPDRINHLLLKMDTLLKKQDLFSREIDELRGEIDKLRASAKTGTRAEDNDISEIVGERNANKEPDTSSFSQSISMQRDPVKPKDFTKPKAKRTVGTSLNLEKFIGENLINKLGIVITVLGVGIGAKYSIDHQLISPFMRILLGYLMGLGLLGTGLKLKSKYENYSAVLVSGAMAIMYFISYFAFSFYDLISQVPAFLLMVIFTAATVYAALEYNKQVIAHIGLVGAYAVPFLLSKESGNAVILFSYMAIINIGILLISFRKNWKPLYYVSFTLSWIIYLSWLNLSYRDSEHLGTGLIFTSLFFSIFYLTFLVSMLREKAEFDTPYRLLLLANSAVYFGTGFYILNNSEAGTHFSGVFALGNALVHLIAALVIYRQKPADRNLFYFVSGLVVVFLTIAIPVQFDGKWVTILWAGEAAALFWIGRTKAEPVYEKLSYPLLMIAFFSLLHDWGTDYNLTGPQETLLQITPLLNLRFLNSIFFIGIFGFVTVLHQNKNYTSALVDRIEFKQLFSFLLPAVLLSVVYFAFRLEFAGWFQQVYENSAVQTDPAIMNFQKNKEILLFKSLWMTIYTFVFLILLSSANIVKLKSRELGYINLSINALVILAFLINDLFILGNLRQTYMEGTMAEYFPRGIVYLAFRYLSFAFVALVLYTTHTYIKQAFLNYNFRKYFDFLLHGSILWIASAELIHWMDLTGSDKSYKLGLSILWGVYSLFLIVLGIWKKKKHLRIGAISLFGVTLIKLFIYDISHLETIPKTIIFIALGLLLLIISFLYNKYKHIISEETEYRK